MNYEKLVTNIYVIVTAAHDSIPVPVGTVIRVNDIRDPRTVIGVIYGCDSTIVTTVEDQTKINKMVGNPIKIPSIAVQIYPGNALHECLTRYSLPVDFYAQIQGKILINKKNDCYYISPQIMQLLEIDPEMIKETRLKFIHGNKSLYICETYSDSDDLNHTSFTVEESGAFKINKEDSKVLEEMFIEYFGAKEVEEIIISKMPTVIKSDRLSYSQGFKLNLERTLKGDPYMFKSYRETLGENPEVVAVNMRDESSVQEVLSEADFLEEEELDANTQMMLANLERTNPEAAVAIRRTHLERQRNIRRRQ